MRHFVSFLLLVFAVLFIAVYSKNKTDLTVDSLPQLRIFGPNSFVSRWGPGPGLKELFERDCQCRVEFIDGGDLGLLIQRLQSDSATVEADLVLGFDQYDLERANQELNWRKVEDDGTDWAPNIAHVVHRYNFVSYDWGVLAFILRKSEFRMIPGSFDDFLKPEFSGRITLPDPRTSTPGFQFLLWLIQAKGEEGAFQYLAKLEPQILTYAPTWSAAYGLFSKGQAKTTLSYTSSPLYHLLEEKNSDVVAVEMKEQHPLQVEYFGIPISCRNCELAQKFARTILSPAGQKLIMEKNYMFPVVNKVRSGTPFADVPAYQTLGSNVIPGREEKERILKRWVELRKAH